jgi:hypothetical protein
MANGTSFQHEKTGHCSISAKWQTEGIFIKDQLLILSMTSYTLEAKFEVSRTCVLPLQSEAKRAYSDQSNRNKET